MADLDPRRRVVETPPRRRLPSEPAARAVRVMQGLVVPRGRGARKPLALLPWEREVTEVVFRDQPEQAVVSVPRGSGKSTLASAMGVYGATYEGTADAVIPLVGVNEEGARRLLWIARRFVENDAALADRAKVYSDRIRFPCWNSEIVALPAEPHGLLGLDFGPLCIVDEIGAIGREQWDALVTALGKRDHATLLGIGSPVPGASDLLRELLETDGVWSRHYCAPEGCDVHDREAWKTANPSYGVLVNEKTMANLAATTPEPVFRSFRLGQFTDVAGVWLPVATWDERADVARVVADGEPVVLGFDGSFARDCTVLVGSTLDGHVFVVDVWEAPKGDTTWRVPRREVHSAVEAAFDRWDVRAMACDPFLWRDALDEWARTYGEDRVVEWPTNSWPRMAKAAERFHAAVMEGTLSHDGDSRLRRHVAQCHVKVTPNGLVPVKDGKNSPRRIDAAVAAVIAHDYAHQLPEKPPYKSYVFRR